MIDQYINQYGKRLYGLCIKLCVHTFDADDLYQETWLKVMRHIQSYHTNEPFEPWLTRICINTYRDLLRKEKLKNLFFSFNGEDDLEYAKETITVDEPQDYAELYEAINRLPEKMRVTVILHYFNHLDLQKTADILNVPVGTIKSRLYQAKKILRKELENAFDLQF